MPLSHSPVNSVGRVTGSSPASRGYDPRIGLYFLIHTIEFDTVNILFTDYISNCVSLNNKNSEDLASHLIRSCNNCARYSINMCGLLLLEFLHQGFSLAGWDQRTYITVLFKIVYYIF